jgi:roadblock/LC7 domain-containing protein
MPVNQILNTDNTYTGINTYDNYIISNLGFRLFDVTPSTKYFELSVLGNAMEFVPSFNNNSFEFYTKNSTGTTTIIPLTIEFASTTFNNTIICNYGATSNNSLPTTSLNPTMGTQIVKNYCDTKFQLISNMNNYVNITTAQSIAGNKTFTGNTKFNAYTEFTGSNGYFQINCGMSGGTYNPASTAGTIGIIGLKDQTNDNVLFTLYENIHVAIKLNFSSVSMGFGGNSQSPTTSVVCDGTNVVIKLSLKEAGDNTIQNSAVTGAG